MKFFTRRRSQVVAALVSALLAVAGVIVAAQVAAAAPTNQQCAYADPGTGTYARTLCWLDQNGYDPAAASSPGGQQMKVALPGGYTLQYTVTALGRAVVPAAFPTYASAYLGRNNGGYRGVAGLPAFYQAGTTGGNSTLSMTGISVTDADGNPVDAFSIVLADAESTDINESLRFTATAPLRQIAPLGNACEAGFTGIGTNTVTCSSNQSATRTGTAILAADAPTAVSIDLNTNRRQGVAFGILLSKVVLSKTVASRVSPSDSFGLSVTARGGIQLASANTGTATTATTGEVETIGAATTSPFTLAETATGTTPIGAYAQSWSCTRNGSADPTLPSGAAGPSADVALAIGDLVNCTITNTALSGNLLLQKEAGPVNDVNGNGVRDAGDTIPYSFTVTNTGQVPVEGVTVNDPSVGAVTCPVTTLAPGDSTRCTADSLYTITAADVASGAFTNVATAQGTLLGGTTVIRSNTSATTTTLEAADARLTLVKAVSPGNAATAGTTATYDYTATNTGNVDVHALAIVESAFSGSGTVPAPVCPVTSLAPGTSTVCTATYTVTQADVDAGSVTNTAHATATDPESGTVDSAPSSATLTSAAAPAIALEKSASPDDAASFVVGQELTYSFVATNTGNVTLTDVGIDEQGFTGTGGAVNPVCPAGAPIPPGGQVTCTATYTLTQADIDQGDVTNTATAHGTPPTGPAVSSAPDTISAPGNPAPAITVEKTATPSTVAAQGDAVQYTFTVTNSGNVTLKDVTVDETAFSGSGGTPAVSCPAEAATMLPGARMVCTASYTLTQADADQSQLVNTATATGTPPASAGGPVTSAPSTATVAVAENPALSLVKTASPLHATAAGDTITYSFAVTNTGDTTVNGIGIAEGSFSGSGPAPSPNCPAGAASLAPGATVTCTATYTVTLADANAGGIDNHATATGTTGSGTAVTSADSQTVVPIQADPAVTLQKTASIRNVTAAGQTITYSFVVTNTGNVTLQSPQVVEARFSGYAVLDPVCPAGVTSLAPGESVTCTADYVTTQADIDKGGITNSAVATLQTPGGATITAPPSEVDITADPAPALAMEKTVDPTAITAAGQPVSYSYLVTNTGNVTLTGVAVAEGDFTGSGGTPVPSCPADAASLAPGATVTCTASYTPTQADVDAGTVTNTATASGTPIGGGAAVDSEPSSTTFSATASPDLTITKTADPATITRAGETVTYSFVVTNTGNVTMSEVEVIEGTFTGTGIAPVVQCPAAPIVLAPGSTVTCTATYTTTQADVDAGTLDNTASVQGSIPSAPGVPLTFGPAGSSVDAPADPALTIVKSGAPSDAASFVAGAAITYTFVVTNTGNVTLDDLQVSDSGFTGSGAAPVPDCSGGPTSLAPAEQLTCTATYTVTQADADAGGISNTATASGVPPTGGEPVLSAPSTVTLPHDSAPALGLVKSATVTGSTIDYRFAVTNTGNVTVNGIAIAEGDFTGTGAFPAIDCPQTALAPGELTVCTATYSLTDADRRAGAVTNTATAHGDAAGGPVSSAPSSARAALGGLASTGLDVSTVAWLAGILLAIGGAAFGFRFVRRRRA
ncbi:beta strand repeat-containing protein [Leifsonia shinshuensis]